MVTGEVSSSSAPLLRLWRGSMRTYRITSGALPHTANWAAAPDIPLRTSQSDMSRTSEPFAANFSLHSSFSVPTSYTRRSPPNVPATRMVRHPAP
eukprot:scaffold12227_cov171-Isochrysis_galbana.AAC.1